METTTKTVNLKAEAVKDGVIWAVINIAIFLVVYYVMPQLMSSYWFSGLQLIIGILLAIYFCKDLRTKAGGYWSFSQALLHIFIMFFLSAALVYCFTLLFGKVIDPQYAVKMKEMIITKTETTLKDFGMSEDQITEAIAKTNENLEKQFNPTISQAIVGLGITGILYFVGALIFAAIFKKERPLFLEGEQEEAFPAPVE